MQYIMEQHNRRWFLKASGATLATAAFAGCIGDDDDADPDEWEGVDRIVLRGYQSHWEGVEPSHIEGDQNPTLVLFEGQEYTFEWINGDGLRHDLQIFDADNNLVEDYASEVLDNAEESTTMQVTATPAMARYICTFHSATQVGDIEIR